MSVQFQVVELPSAHHICKVRALNKGDANSEVTVYYQVSWSLAQVSSWLSTFRALKLGVGVRWGVCVLEENHFLPRRGHFEQEINKKF